MQVESSAAVKFAHKLAGVDLGAAKRVVFWAHGWGQDGRAFEPLAQTLGANAAHVLFDLPGFGASPPPPPTWTTADYADAVAPLVERLRNGRPAVWIGHSFGGRVGIQLAARHPGVLAGLALIAAAGLPRNRSTVDRLRLQAKVTTFKVLKRMAPLLGQDVGKLREKFGSADYRNAGPMRDVFLSAIREDLTDAARRVRVPVLLIYGANDTETPPEIGERLSRLIPSAKLSVLPGQDHYSVLGSGRHVVATRLLTFMEQL